MNWIKVNPLHRIAASLSNVSGLPCIVVSRGHEAAPPDELGDDLCEITEGNVDIRESYESDFEDIAWELGLQVATYGR